MEQTVTTEVETATGYCPNGCGYLCGLGECACCGYVGDGVGQLQTDYVIDADEETGKYVRVRRVDPEIDSCADCGQELTNGECRVCLALVDIDDDPHEDDGVSQGQQDYCNLLDEIHTLQACLENEREAYTDLAEALAKQQQAYDDLERDYGTLRRRGDGWREAYGDLAEDLASLMAEYNKLQAKWNRVRLAVKESAAFLAGLALACVLATIHTRIWG